MEKSNALLTGLLLRLAVELESDCMAAVDAGGNVLDVPIAWLDSHGFGYLAPYPCAVGELLRPRKVIDFDPLTLTAAARVVRNALFVADEILQLDGESALDYVAGWVGGASTLAADHDHYLSQFVDFIPTYRDFFIAGYQRGETEMRTVSRQRERRAAAEGNRHETA